MALLLISRGVPSFYAMAKQLGDDNIAMSLTLVGEDGECVTDFRTQ